MAGYSGTPLPKKLGIKESHRILFVDAPHDFNELLGPLPTGIEILTAARSPLDLVVLFIKSEKKTPCTVRQACRKTFAGGHALDCMAQEIFRRCNRSR